LGNNLYDLGDIALSINNPDMADWFAAPGPGAEIPGQWNFGNYNGAVACMSYQPAREWIINDMIRCIVDYDIDHLKHDRRTVAQTCNEPNHGHLNNSGDISIRCAKGFYEATDTFRNDYGILIESGVMGGRILDYGLMKHCHYTGISDDYDPMSNRQAFYDISHAMPSRILEAYVGNIELGDTVISLNYNLRSGMLCWCSLIARIDEWTAGQMYSGRRQFDIYKYILRPQIRNGNLYHISERPDPNSWDAYEYYTPSNGTGVIFVFRSEDCNEPDAPAIKLKGLESTADYYVAFEDGYGDDYTTKGRKLMEDGIEWHSDPNDTSWLPCPASSELIYINK
jgi:alpha-galactosidase